MNKIHEVWFLRTIQCKLFEICFQLQDDDSTTKDGAAQEILSVIQQIDEYAPQIKGE